MKKVLIIALMSGLIVSGAQARLALTNHSDGKAQVTIESPKGDNKVYDLEARTFQPQFIVDSDLYGCPLTVTVKKLSGTNRGKQISYGIKCNEYSTIELRIFDPAVTVGILNSTSITFDE